MFRVPFREINSIGGALASLPGKLDQLIAASVRSNDILTWTFALRNTEIDRGADQLIPFQLIETGLDPKALGTGPAAQRLR
jgi:hypothetical protein